MKTSLLFFKKLTDTGSKTDNHEEQLTDISSKLSTYEDRLEKLASKTHRSIPCTYISQNIQIKVTRRKLMKNNSHIYHPNYQPMKTASRN